MYIEMVVMTPTKMTPDGILSLGGQIPDLRLVLIFFPKSFNPDGFIFDE